jgi:hypothetical protein
MKNCLEPLKSERRVLSFPAHRIFSLGNSGNFGNFGNLFLAVVLVKVEALGGVTLNEVQGERLQTKS